MQRIGVTAVFDISAFTRNSNIYIKTINKINVLNQNVAGGASMLGRTISTALGNSFAYLATRAIPAAINKLWDFASSAISVGADFQDQMAIVKAASDDPTISIGDLSQAAIAVGNDVTVFGASAVGAAEAMALLYKGGLNINAMFGDMRGYLGGTAKLGGAVRGVFDLVAASTLTIDQAADAAIVTLSTFGRELETDAEKADFVNDSFDYMVRAANASVAEVEDLTGAYGYIGPAAAQAGLSIYDTTTAIALLSQFGIKGTRAGRSLASMMTNLIDPSKAAGAVLTDLGINVFDPTTEKMYPLIDIIGQLGEAVSGMSDEAKLTKLEDIFTQVGGRAAFALIEQGIGGWNDMADSIDNAIGIEEQAAIMMDTLTGKAEILDSSVETLKIQIEQGLDEALKNAMVTLNDLVQNVGPGIVQFFDTFGTALNAVVLLFGNSSVIEDFGGAIDSIFEGDWSAAFLDLYNAISTLFGEEVAIEWSPEIIPFLQELAAVGPEIESGWANLTGGDFFGGLATLGELFLEVFGEEYSTDWLATIIPYLNDLSAVTPELTAGFEALIGGDIEGGLLTLGAALDTVFGTDITGVVTGLASAFKAFSEGDVSGGLDGIGDAIGLAFGEESQADFENIIDAIARFGAVAIPIMAGVAAVLVGAGIFSAVALIGGYLSVILPVIAGALAAINLPLVLVIAGVALLAAVIAANWSSISPVVEALGAAFAAMWEVLAGVVSFVGELMAPVLAELGVAFSDLWTAIQPVVLVLGGILVAAIGIVVGVLAGLIAGIAGLALGFAKILVGVVQMATGIIDIVVGLVEVIIGLIRGNNEQVAEAWEKMKSGAINILTGLWNVVVGIFAGLFLAVVLAIGTFIETVIQFFTTLYEKLVGGSIIPDMVKAIVEWFTTLASDAIALVSDLVAKVVEWFTTLVADAVALATEFVTGIIDQIKELPVKVKTWMMKTLDNVKMLTSKFKEVGGNLIKGLAQGIKDAAGKVIDAAKAVVTSAINAAKNLLREGSPSKVFMEIGEDVSLGMGVGIEKGARYPIGAIGGLVSGMTRAAGQSVTNQTTNYYSTNVEVNPTYRNYESEAGIYYDVSAALSGVRQ